MLLTARDFLHLMHQTLSCYLRTIRKSWALTQPELARLLGFKNYQYISRVESGTGKPDATVLLGLEILFGTPSASMFPKLYDEVEETVVAKLYALQQRLEGDPSPEAARKRRLAGEALSRAVLREHQPMDHEA